jgi:hypothetical protein
MTRRKSMWILMIAQTIYVAFTAVWIILAAMSVMMFDSPDAMSQVGSWFFIVYILSYPLGLLAGIIAGWILFIREKYKAALLWNVFPLVWILSILGIFAYWNIVG